MKSMLDSHVLNNIKWWIQAYTWIETMTIQKTCRFFISKIYTLMLMHSISKFYRQGMCESKCQFSSINATKPGIHDSNILKYSLKVKTNICAKIFWHLISFGRKRLALYLITLYSSPKTQMKGSSELIKHWVIERAFWILIQKISFSTWRR